MLPECHLRQTDFDQKPGDKTKTQEVLQSPFLHHYNFKMFLIQNSFTLSVQRNSAWYKCLDTFMEMKMKKKI